MMDSQKLSEIRNNLYILPALKERAEKLRRRIFDAEGNVQELLHQYEKECLDVEQLKNNSFSTTLLKWVGKYEDRLEKESEESLAAKLEYDKATERVKELQRELKELEDRISALEQERRIYEAEIAKREQMILNQLNNEKSAQYKRLEEERKMLTQQLVEMDEAIRAGKRAKSIASDAISHLDDAESWASIDVWTRGGILSHMAKYKHIDQAESAFNRLSSQMRDFQKELADINILNTTGLSCIDTSTRAIDFWFDNIFTDLRVRDEIRSNSDQIRTLYGSIDKAISTVERKKTDIHKTIEDIEYQKKELLISL